MDIFLLIILLENDGLRLIPITGDCSPKSPFLGATSAKLQKNGEQDYSP